jgi:cytidylate kinase
MIIAVDGPTASGKGTIAKRLAKHLGLAYLDTGLLYRAVGRQVAMNDGDPDVPSDALAATCFPDTLLADQSLRTEEAGGLASRVSVHRSVREALYERQRDFARQPGGAVLDGRDIGTVIAPDADVKLFITASVQARARRRWLEMIDKGLAEERDIPLAEIERDVVTRDARDINRADAPLKAASDALIIDTTSLDREAAFELALEAVESILTRRGSDTAR